MARLKSSFLFEVNGKIGDYVVRKMNGKTFISYRPGKYKISKSKPAKEARNNFAAASKFSSIINSYPFLIQAWQNSLQTIKPVYHKILKENLKFVSSSCLNVKNIIVPDSTLNIIKEIIFEGTLIKIILDTESVSEININFSDLNIAAICYLHSPKDSNKSGAYKFISLSKSFVFEEPDSPLSEEINLTKQELEDISDYNSMIIYSAAVIKKENEINWSSLNTKIP